MDMTNGHDPDALSRLSGVILDGITAVLFLACLYCGARWVVDAVRPDRVVLARHHPPAKSLEETRK